MTDKSADHWIRPGFFLMMTVQDFARPRRQDYEPQDPEPEPMPPDPPSPPKRFIPQEVETPKPPPRKKYFMDHEYPEWNDDLPPWRNPDPKGDPYLYVPQQHGSRLRGHH